MNTTTATETRYAILSDVAPTRATVEFVGDEEEATAANLHAYTDCLCVPVASGVAVEVGDRVWIQRAGSRVVRVSAGE